MFDRELGHPQKGVTVKTGAGDVAGKLIGMPGVEDGVRSEIPLVDVELHAEVIGEPLFVADVGRVRRSSLGIGLNGFLCDGGHEIHGQRLGVGEVEGASPGSRCVNTAVDHRRNPIHRHEVFAGGRIDAQK